MCLWPMDDTKDDDSVDFGPEDVHFLGVDGDGDEDEDPEYEPWFDDSSDDSTSSLTDDDQTYTGAPSPYPTPGTARRPTSTSHNWAPRARLLSSRTRLRPSQPFALGGRSTRGSYMLNCYSRPLAVGLTRSQSVASSELSLLGSRRSSTPPPPTFTPTFPVSSASTSETSPTPKKGTSTG